MTLPDTLTPLYDRENEGCGLSLLSLLPDGSVPAVILDPQYRGVLDRMNYGPNNNRMRDRLDLVQMPEDVIREFLSAIARVLEPSGHLFLWLDKFHLIEGVLPWLEGLPLAAVDMITWNKERMGMGYRSRRVCEYVVVIQKLPKRAKGRWTLHDIPDVWSEKTPRTHTHSKPVSLQSRLIAATVPEGGLVVDPAAGGFSSMHAAHAVGRRFLGTNLSSSPPAEKLSA